MNINALMNQARKMQQVMAKKQAEFAAKEFNHSASGGAINITMDGKFKITSLDIDEDILDDKEMLEESLTIAVNELTQKILKAKEDIAPKQMGGMF